MPTVTVRCFAVLREARGLETEEVEVEEGTNLRDLYLELFPPGIGPAVPVTFARNGVRAPADTTLCEGDEILILPPVGGG
jgi:molybdopterin converting factor small subunit